MVRDLSVRPMSVPPTHQYHLCPQTYLFKVTTFSEDGTLTISRTVPCDAGASTDICFVEVGQTTSPSFHVPSEVKFYRQSATMASINPCRRRYYIEDLAYPVFKAVG